LTGRLCLSEIGSDYVSKKSSLRLYKGQHDGLVTLLQAMISSIRCFFMSVKLGLSYWKEQGVGNELLRKHLALRKRKL
jgi:hypothetical protein